MRILNSICCLLAFAGLASAQVLWEDNLDTDTSLNYDIFEFLEGRDGAVFGFDYGDLGIPSAPNSDGGSTTGVRLFSNDPFEDTSAAPGGVRGPGAGIAPASPSPGAPAARAFGESIISKKTQGRDAAARP